MAQNTSSAVMQQRHEALDSLDDFPSPPWAARALMEHVLPFVRGGFCWEPACNRGFLVRGLNPYFERVQGTDIFDYGVGPSLGKVDFLFPGTHTGEEKFDWIITNPPFVQAAAFIKRARELSGLGCAMLVRTAFTAGQERYEEIFRDTPPTIVAHFAERVIMHKGILRDPDVKYWNPKGKNPETGEKTGCWQYPSTATDYIWVVWMHDEAPRPTLWIPPCRKTLTVVGDYEIAA